MPEADDAAAAIADAVSAVEGPMTERKRRIVMAAVSCFAESGYEATSTSEIARRAKVAEATIFRHFQSKRDLLLRILRPVLARILVPAAIDELGEVWRESEGRFEKVAAALIRSRLRFFDRYAPLIRILMQELPLHADLRQMFLDEGAGRMLAAVFDLLDRFKREGQIRDLPNDRLVRTFISQVLGYYMVRSMMAPAAAYDDEIEVPALIDVIVNGIGSGSR